MALLAAAIALASKLLCLVAVVVVASIAAIGTVARLVALLSTHVTVA